MTIPGNGLLISEHDHRGAPASPTHHVPETELVEHLTGRQDEAVSLAIGCHLAMCPACRDQALPLDPLWGTVLPDGEAASAPPPELARLGLPPLLLGRLPSGVIRWRYVAPGARGIDIALKSHDTTVRLMRLRPGLVIPKHDHGLREVTLIFSGALADAGGRFQRGDLSFRKPGETHAQRVAPGQDCVALVVNGGSLVPLTWAGRMLRLIARP